MAGGPLYVLDQYKYSFDGSLPGLSGSGSVNISGSFTINFDRNSAYAFGGTTDFKVDQYNFRQNGVPNQIRNLDGTIQYRVDFSGTSSFSNENIGMLFTFPVNGRLINSFDTAQYTKTVLDYMTVPSTTNAMTYGLKNLAVTSSLLSEAPCFTTGTRIRTARGEIAVENLKIGDHAITVSGALRPVIWIGHRDLATPARFLRYDLQPVRIRAGAFGPGLPTRDLFLSPGHPVLVGAGVDGEGGHLVPIMGLINGTSIAREPVTAVTYWHVELDSHDILLAEGLPAESYLDWGDRPFFTEASDHALHNPDFVVPGLSARCRPVAVDGPVVEAERARLSGVFAAALGADCAWDEAERFAWIAA